MLQKIVLAVCIAATLNMSAGLTGASAAPRGGHASGGHPAVVVQAAVVRGALNSAAATPTVADPGADTPAADMAAAGMATAHRMATTTATVLMDTSDGYDNGAAIAAGIIGTAIGAIAASQHRCW